MKKHLKKLSRLIMALTLAISVMLPSMPVLADDTTTIKVTGIEEGANVYAYAVAIDAVDANGNHYWKYNTSGTSKTRIEDGSISSEDMIYFYTNLNTGTGWDAHDGGGNAVVDAIVLSLTWNEADASYSVDNVAPGLYVIAANKENKIYSYTGNVVAVNYQYDSTGVASIADVDGVVNVVAKKADDPVLKKEVVQSDDSTSKHGDAKIGDVVEFKISLTMPSYTGSWQTDNLHYIITDSLSEGLTLDTTSIAVEGTNITELFDEDSRKCASTTVTTSTEGFTLNLYGEDVYQYQGRTITITYSATVNDKAKVNFAQEENKVSIQYSTAAGSTDLSTPITDTTYHYTFGLDTAVNGTGSTTTTELTKYGVRTTTETNNQVPLAGAQFQLYDSAGNLLYFTSAGQYTTDTTNGRNYVESNSSGQIVVSGLSAGTYTLKESKAPTGYALDFTV